MNLMKICWGLSCEFGMEFILDEWYILGYSVDLNELIIGVVLWLHV
jgi:hypothetical protein